MFYQPLMDYLKTRSTYELESIPLGIYSGLKREMDLRLDDYLLDFPEDKEVEKKWEEIKEKALVCEPY